MDERTVNADQPRCYSHLALQNMVSKTADQHNHSVRADLDFDMYPVSEYFGQGTTKTYACIFFFGLDVHKVIKGFLVGLVTRGSGIEKMPRSSFFPSAS